MKTTNIVAVLLSATLSAFQVNAAVRPAAWIGNGMVLQRGAQVTLRGTADPQESVSVAFKGETPLTPQGKRVNATMTTTAADNGQWSIELPVMKPGGPYEMLIGDQRLTDIYVGDVYFCTGQSNMELPTSRVMDLYSAEINGTVRKDIHLLRVNLETNYTADATDIKTDGWKHLEVDNAKNFSAIAYFFAREMQVANHVPVGVVQAAVGGTPIEAWMSRESLEGFDLILSKLDVNADPSYRKTVEDYGQAVGNRWESVLAQKEAALALDWKSETFDDSQWTEVCVTQPTWGHDSLGVHNGAHWFRKVVNVSAEQAAMQATLRLGTLVDADEVWVNGTKVGQTYYQYPPRIYDIAPGTLHAGANVIALRLVSQYGRPQFTPEKYRGIFFGQSRWLAASHNSEIVLDSTWRHLYAVPMPQKQGIPFFYYTPTVLYNAMVAPLVGMKWAGALWYQGESNVGREGEYAILLRRLMSCWRSTFAQPELDFVIATLADFERPVSDSWRAMQQTQRNVAAEDPHAASAEMSDLGEWNDVHPLNKKTAAMRMARAMRGLKKKTNTTK